MNLSKMIHAPIQEGVGPRGARRWRKAGGPWQYGLRPVQASGPLAKLSPEHKKAFDKFYVEFKANPNKTWRSGTDPSLVRMIHSDFGSEGRMLRSILHDMGVVHEPSLDHRQRAEDGVYWHRLHLDRKNKTAYIKDDDGEHVRDVPIRELENTALKIWAHTQAHLPDEVEVHRGVAGKYAKGLKAAPDSMKPRGLSSWTESTKAAQDYAKGERMPSMTEDPGHATVITAKVPRQYVFASWKTDHTLLAAGDHQSDKEVRLIGTPLKYQRTKNASDHTNLVYGT